MPTLLARLRPGRAPWRLAATALALGTAWQLSAQGVPDPQDSAGPVRRATRRRRRGSPCRSARASG
jgi:hypothetical protein